MKAESDRKKWRRIRRRLFNMVSVGVVDDPVNKLYDIISITALIINLAAVFIHTFDDVYSRYKMIIDTCENVTVFFFAVDYVLRLLTAKYLYPNPKYSEVKSLIKYIFSFAGIVDLLSFLPSYLPVFFPAGTTVFRVFRVIRILRLFRINAYYDSLNVIAEVIINKRQQLLSSVFIVLVLMAASSLCMYSLEHTAQPDVFENAFSGIWWAASTLLTVGYGDIYPVTAAGKAFGIIITFLGCGMVAIPTGIISAGFVEQYSRMKKMERENEEISFIQVKLIKKDIWTGKRLKDIKIPFDMIVAAVSRGPEIIIPKDDLVLNAGDIIYFGSEDNNKNVTDNIIRIDLDQDHEWAGKKIADLDISRRSYVVLVNRHGTAVRPDDDFRLRSGDEVFLYTKSRI